MTLSAFSLASFAGGIAGVTSGLPLGFQGGFPRCLLGKFRIARLLLVFQRGLTSGSLSERGFSVRAAATAAQRRSRASPESGCSALSEEFPVKLSA